MRRKVSPVEVRQTCACAQTCCELNARQTNPMVKAHAAYRSWLFISLALRKLEQILVTAAHKGGRCPAIQPLLFISPLNKRFTLRRERSTLC